MFEVASSKFSGIQQLTKLHTDYMYVLPVPHAAGAHARAQCRATRWAPVVGSYVSDCATVALMRKPTGTPSPTTLLAL